VAAAFGCARCSALADRPDPVAIEAEPLEGLRLRYQDSMSRARRWLDDLHVDPFELRRAGIKGKKKLVEHLDSYYRLWQVASPAERNRILDRIREIVAITYEDRYHDMASISDRWFKQDATSYLRGAVLMERLGLDTTRYRDEIRKIHGRLNAHMKTRGPYQRQVFHWYYQTFGLTEPFPLADSLNDGVIARQVDPSGMTNDDVYSITHEVYALFEYGDRLDIDPFDAESTIYLWHALDVLGQRYIDKGDPDLAAEIVECLHYLRMQDAPIYLVLVRYLLDSQNADGSWGTYERYRKRLREYVNQGFVLHTTMVAIGALTAIFERPMPPSPAHAGDTGQP